MVLSLANVGANGALNGYWGQSGTTHLRDYCDSGVQYATLSFINSAPEHDPTGNEYPSINFSSFCGAAGYIGPNGMETALLKDCASLKADIPYCQSQGVKVILSIGGEYGPSNNYAVTSDENGEYFAEFLYNAFGPYNDKWGGPRPFDSDSGSVAVDGFDFDIEAKLDNKPYIAMINKLRSLDDTLLITGAPQCPTNPEYFHMQDMIREAAFDALFIQFYNNPSCDAIPDNDPWNGEFNYDDWVEVVAGSKKSDTKLFIGLPGSPEAAGSGYIPPENVKEMVCKYREADNFGGISLWDLNYAASNDVGDMNFYEHVKDALDSDCKSAPATTSTTTTSSKISSTSWTSGSSTSSTSSTSSINTTSATVSTNATTTTVSKVPAVSVPDSSTTSNSVRDTTSSIVVSSTGMWSNSTIVTSSTSVSLTTSTVYTTSVYTVTKCPSYVTNCPEYGHVTTETIPLYTTVCPATQTALPRPRPTEKAKTAVPVKLPLTTSTVYTTTTRTITACPPEITDCPKGKVTTEVIPWYTTVCPTKETETETEDAKIPQPTPPGPGGVKPSQRIATVPGGGSTVETFTKPTAVVPKPSHAGFNSSSGVAVPTQGWTGTAVGPSSVPIEPIRASASTLAIGLTGLIAMVVVQVFAL